MKYLLMSLAIAALFSPFAFPEDKSMGCGLGQLAAPEKTWVSITTRGVVDYLVPSVPSAMTTGTSGCDRHSIVKREKRAIHFAEANYGSLEIEMAQGGGEYLTGFAKVLGCQSSVVPLFSQAAKQNYVQVMPSTDRDASQLLTNVQHMIQQTPNLASGCAGPAI